MWMDYALRVVPFQAEKMWTRAAFCGEMRRMTPDEFVAGLIRQAVDGAVEGTLNQLHKPSGREPSPGRVEESEWFNGLSDREKEGVTGVMRRCAELSLFSVLTVLDGVSFIEDGEVKGSFRLSFEKEGTTTLLNPDDGEYLHDIMNSMAG